LDIKTVWSEEYHMNEVDCAESSHEASQGGNIDFRIGKTFFHSIKKIVGLDFYETN
jgi:hypothetical protein